MILDHISVINYRNLEQVDLDFSEKLNCFFGQNGMGKTNLLDAIYYLSFCKSASNPTDSQNIHHDGSFFMVQGQYRQDIGTREEIYCALKRHQKKVFKRNQKEYQRLSEHIGLMPLVMVSPADSSLILGTSEERRRFMDQVISQYDKGYLEDLIRYNKALVQRNAMLKDERIQDEELFLVTEELMAESAERISRTRKEFVEGFIPAFQEIYGFICQDTETVSLRYSSHLLESGLKDQLRQLRDKERIVGYTLHGTHRDDLEMLLGGFPIRKEGSQGQSKTYLVALKLAQYEFLRHKGKEIPLLLLDDIFDKLDAGRVEQIVKLTASDRFGQIFITDTNRENLDRILEKTGSLHRIFSVESGTITPLEKP